MTIKKNPNLTKSEALILAWKKRKDYKGYDKSKGSMYNSWRAVLYTKKGQVIGFPKKWETFNGFLEDMSDDWSKNKILLRNDKTKPYSKENCYWGKRGEENIGKLTKLEYKGKTKTILEWCDLYNLNYNGVRQRYFKGKNFTIEEILFSKKLNQRKYMKDINDLDPQRQRDKVSKMLSQYKLRDKKRDLEFNITIEDGIKLMNKPCVYCGDTKNVGLDRKDNTIGHILSNVVSCCYSCNTMRQNNFTFEEMLELGKYIAIIIKKRRK